MQANLNHRETNDENYIGSTEPINDNSQNTIYKKAFYFYINDSSMAV